MGAVKNYFLGLFDEINEVISSILLKYGYNLNDILSAGTNNGIVILGSQEKVPNIDDINSGINFIEYLIVNYNKTIFYYAKVEMYENIMAFLKEYCNNQNKMACMFCEKDKNDIIKNIINNIIIILKKHNFNFEDIQTKELNNFYSNYFKNLCCRINKNDLKIFIDYIEYLIIKSEEYKLSLINKELYLELCAKIID